MLWIHFVYLLFPHIWHHFYCHQYGYQTFRNNTIPPVFLPALLSALLSKNTWMFFQMTPFVENPGLHALSDVEASDNSKRRNTSESNICSHEASEMSMYVLGLQWCRCSSFFPYLSHFKHILILHKVFRMMLVGCCHNNCLW